MKSFFARLGFAWMAICLCVPWVLHAGPIPAHKPSAYPNWWFEGDVIPRLNPSNTNPDYLMLGTYATPDDYAVVNQGQVKNIVRKAYLEMQARGLIEVNSPLTTMVTAWGIPGATTDDYRAINLGQLKNVAEPFYARLAELGYTGQPLVPGQTRPWNGTGADDYALANIGQVKNLFSFSFPTDSDENGFLDAWEWQYFGHLGVDANANPSGDGMSNLYKYAMGLNPLIDEGSGDKDGDGVINSQDARPNNSAGGLLTITISFPVSGGEIL